MVHMAVFVESHERFQLEVYGEPACRKGWLTSLVVGDLLVSIRGGGEQINDVINVEPAAAMVLLNWFYAGFFKSKYCLYFTIHAYINMSTVKI